MTDKVIELFGEFTEDGISIKTHLVERGGQLLFCIVAETADGKLCEKIVPVYHEPRYGYDVDDVDRCEVATDELLRKIKG